VANETRLETPYLTVSMADGRELTVRVLNPDYLRWDRTAAKHGWPAMAKAPFTWLTFVAWAALRREGQIPEDVTWEAFSERECLQVRNAKDEANGHEPAVAALAGLRSISGDLGDLMDAEAPDGVDPTLPDPEPV